MRTMKCANHAANRTQNTRVDTSRMPASAHAISEFKASKGLPPTVKEVNRAAMHVFCSMRQNKVRNSMRACTSCTDKHVHVIELWSHWRALKCARAFVCKCVCAFWLRVRTIVYVWPCNPLTKIWKNSIHQPATSRIDKHNSANAPKRQTVVSPMHSASGNDLIN